MVESLVFFRSMAVIINAGLPLHDGLQSLADSTADKSAAHTYAVMSDQIASGWTFSDAMARHPDHFDRYMVGLIRVGEKSGSLPRILTMLADGLEKSYAVRGKLKASLAYPLILVVCCLTMIMVAPSWLLEGHLRMLRDSGVALPWPTKLLILWSRIFRPSVVLVLAVALVAVSRWAYHNGKLEGLLGRLEEMPGVGRILKLAACSRFARALAVALRAGVNLLDALRLSADATGNRRLKDVAEQLRKDVVNGGSLGQAVAGAEFFIPGFAQLIEGGEAVGKTDVMLDLGARFYELELELAVSALLTLLEPLLLLTIGVLTAFLLTAVLQPTLSLLQTL